MSLFSISFNACMHVSNNGALIWFFFFKKIIIIIIIFVVVVVVFTCLAFDNFRSKIVVAVSG
jgi:hypothetical protein